MRNCKERNVTQATEDKEEKYSNDRRLMRENATGMTEKKKNREERGQGKKPGNIREIDSFN